MASVAKGESITSHLVVGKTRVRDVDGFLGTIQYIGSVASAKNQEEIYAGVAWDDPSRGKHDGSVISRTTKEIVRHFTCAGGSFLRLTKLDLGLGLNMDLIRSKYVRPDDPLVAPNNVLEHTARTSSGKEKQIEFYGETKLRPVQQPEVLDKLSLRNMGISSIDRNLPVLENVKELDLAGNLICDWNILADIVEKFPNLQELSLASNRMGDIPDCQEVSGNLKILNLHSCILTSAKSIEKLNVMFPCLENLCLANNSFSDLVDNISPVDGFLHLRQLDLSSCNISSWKSQVIKFGKLPLLEHLLLNCNAIESIESCHEDHHFKLLGTLSLSGISVEKWTALNGLTLLPALNNLCVRQTPLTASMGAAEARFNVIARFPKLRMLNSTLITEKEKEQANRRYVAQVTQELLLVDTSKRASFLKEEHARFAELSEKFRREMKLGELGAGNQQSIVTSVNITLKSMASGSCHVAPLQRRLPPSLTIGRLKSMCYRVFGLDIDLQVLHFRTENDAFPSELKNDEYSLAYYGVCDGGEILMNELNPGDILVEEKREFEDFEKRIKHQEKEAIAIQKLQRNLRQEGRL